MLYNLIVAKAIIKCSVTSSITLPNSDFAFPFYIRMATYCPFFFGSSVGVLLLSFIILPLKSMVINKLTTIFNVVFLMPVSVQCHLKTFYYI